MSHVLHVVLVFFYLYTVTLGCLKLYFCISKYLCYHNELTLYMCLQVFKKALQFNYVYFYKAT